MQILAVNLYMLYITGSNCRSQEVRRDHGDNRGSREGDVGHGFCEGERTNMGKGDALTGRRVDSTLGEGVRREK